MQQSSSVNQLNTNDIGDKSPSYPLLHQNVLESVISNDNTNDQQSLLSLLDSIIDDLIFNIVVELHTSDPSTLVTTTTNTLHQSQKPKNGSTRKRRKSLTPVSSTTQQLSTSTINIAKFTAVCPHCGQNNIVAIRFAYHLAKCLGVGRSSARTAKNRLIEYGMLNDADEDEYVYINEHYPATNGILEEQYDASSCTDSTSSSVTLFQTNHNILETKLNGTRRHASEDEYKQDFEDEEEDDDWRPRKKRKRQTTKQRKFGRTKKKQQEQQQSSSIAPVENDFELECIIPLEKVDSVTKETIIPVIQLQDTTVTHTSAVIHKTPEKAPQKNLFFTTKKSPTFSKVSCDQSKLSCRLQPFFNHSSQSSLSTSSTTLPTSSPTSTITTTTTLYPGTPFSHQFILSSPLNNSAK